MSEATVIDRGTVAIESPGATREWGSLARPEFETALRQLGVDGDRLTKDLEFFDEQHRQDISAQRSAILSADRMRFRGVDGRDNFIQNSTRDRLRRRGEAFANWVARRKYVVHEKKVETVQVPIFQLHCPNVIGCKVKYSETNAGNAEMGWKLTVGGTGLGATRTATVKYVANFVAEAGRCKVVFVPIPISMYHIWVFEHDGTFVSSGLRTEVNDEQNQVSFAQALRAVPDNSCVEAARAATESVEVFSLQDDSTGNMSVYEREWTQDIATMMTIGIESFGLKTEVSASVKVTSGLKLTYELAGGHSYELLKATAVPGIAWRVAESV